MRPLRSLMLSLLLVLAWTGAAPALANDHQCAIVIGSCHRAPLSTPQGQGIIDRLVIEAFRRIGLPACIVALPCERSLLNADAGSIDGDILRIPERITGRYPNLAAVPEVLYAMPMNGFTTRADLQPMNFADLQTLRVGHIIGWKILEDQVRAATILRVRGPEELFPLLPEHKAEIVIYDRITGLQVIKELGLKGIRVIEPPLLVTPQHLVLNRRHAALLEPLANALRAMKADGSYDKAFVEAGYAPPR